MKAKRFDADILSVIDKENIIGLRAGSGPHRFIAIWAVVVEGRVFVRSWSLKERSWHKTFLSEPQGAINVAGQELPVRAIRTRSDRLKDAVSRAYRKKYNTPGAIQYVKDMSRAKSRATTTELAPI
jgi:Uncharacterized protein conserved in bacteria (DUF2255).